MAGVTSLKRTLIAKSNNAMVVVTSGACFVVVFCLVASISLISQLTYQNRIIGADRDALKQLQTNIQATTDLENAYNAFINTPSNIIGGNPNGTGSQDGNNAKIVLDALPSTYDYPALATSLESILTSQGVQIQNINGTDEGALQSTTQSTATPTPQPMPFRISVQGDYQSIQKVITVFEHSIRPFQIQTIELNGDQNQLILTVTAQTYWQPAPSLNVGTRIIR